MITINVVSKIALHFKSNKPPCIVDAVLTDKDMAEIEAAIQESKETEEVIDEYQEVESE